MSLRPPVAVRMFLGEQREVPTFTLRIDGPDASVTYMTLTDVVVTVMEALDGFPTRIYLSPTEATKTKSFTDPGNLRR
jgi:hypothetical protein